MLDPEDFHVALPEIISTLADAGACSDAYEVNGAVFSLTRKAREYIARLNSETTRRGGSRGETLTLQR